MTFDPGPIDAFDFPLEEPSTPAPKHRPRVQLSAAAKRAIRRRETELEERMEARNRERWFPRIDPR